MDPQAPPVVAVVVTCDPGPWFEEALAALAAQDYPNLSVLVIDAASATDPTPRVAQVLPKAYVRRLPTNPGYGPACNEALELVEGASHYLFCHDDVAPDPAAVRVMIEEAYRSNAGVVCPKYVAWDDPSRLVQVGLAADKSGAPAPLVERGELDQEQHDAVVDVFWAPGGCLLVRADLFSVLGGFDPAITLYGEDLDLSWRAQLAGARVVVMPEGRVRHREAGAAGERRVWPPAAQVEPDDKAGAERLRRRHQLRAVLKNYSFFHLLVVVPQVALLACAEVLVATITRRWSEARALAGAWAWNGRRVADLRRARRQVRAIRALHDREIRRMQIRGSARFRAFVRRQVPTGSRSPGAFGAPEAGDLVESLAAVDLLGSRDEQAGAWRRNATVVLVVAAVLLVGTRQLLSRIPAVGEFQPVPAAGELLRRYLSGWRTVGLGSTAPAPPALAGLSLASAVVAGASGLVRAIAILGALPIGGLGAFRLGRRLPGSRARIALLVVYLSLPIVYDDLARGRWQGLVAYAVAPWILGAALRAGGGGSARAGQPRWRGPLALGVVLAAAGALAPSLLVGAVVLAVGLALGDVAALPGVEGSPPAGLRALALIVPAVGVAMVLLFPWSLDLFLPGGRIAALAGVAPARAQSLGLTRLLRLATGPVGTSPLAWSVLIAAALPLLVGRSWRWAWAVRAWVAAVVLVVVAWLPGAGWLPFQIAPPEVLLALAGSCLAFSVALGLVSFEVDLPGYRFGWRQGASLIAGLAVIAGLLPVLAGAVGGRWGAPRSDDAELFSWMADQRAAGAFRVLWLGDPRALPVASWRWRDGVGYGFSNDGPPDIDARFVPGDPGPASLVIDDLAIAVRGATSRLGHLLAPLAVRYVIVPRRVAPAGHGSASFPAPADITEALAAQVDLRQLDSDPAMIVYENAAWAAGRAAISADAAAATATPGPMSADQAPLAGAAPILPGGAGRNGAGPVPAGDVYQADARASGWHLTVDGHNVPGQTAFGWATVYRNTDAGRGHLAYRTPALRLLAVLVQFVMWLLALAVLAGTWRRRPLGALLHPDAAAPTGPSPERPVVGARS